MNNIHITTSGNDPVENLAITITSPEGQIIFRGALPQLSAQAETIKSEIQKFQDSLINVQGLVDDVTTLIQGFGIVDVTAPITEEVAAAINAQNDVNTKAFLQAKIDDLSSQVTDLDIKINAAETAQNASAEVRIQ